MATSPAVIASARSRRHGHCERTRVCFDYGAWPLRAVAVDLEPAVDHLGLEPVLAEAQLAVNHDPNCSLRVEVRPQREDERTLSADGMGMVALNELVLPGVRRPCPLRRGA